MTDAAEIAVALESALAAMERAALPVGARYVVILDVDRLVGFAGNVDGEIMAMMMGFALEAFDDGAAQPVDPPVKQ